MRAVIAIALVLGLLGCDANFWDPTRFPPLRSQARIHVTHDPGASAFPLGRYGSVVLGYETLLPDPSLVIPGVGTPNLLSSRFVVSGGPSSGYYVWRGFEDRATSDTTTTGPQPVFSTTAIYDGCRDREYCGDGASSAIAAFDVYPGGIDGMGDDFGCVAIPAGAVVLTGGAGDERVNFRCETTANRLLPVNVEDGIGFGASAVGLPAIRNGGCSPRPHHVGLALFGAPLAHAGEGALYVARATPGLAITEVDLSALDLPANASLGAQMAVFSLDDDRALLAVAARSEEALAPPTVVVMTLTGSDAGVSATVHACLGGAGAVAGFGRSLAIGDLTGDGSPELVVGAGERTPGTPDATETPIAVYGLDALAAGTLVGCAGDVAPSPTHTIECADVEGLECADPSILERTTTGFGASLAVGDLDGDGISDLVVGAPHARVNGIRSGGVVSLRGAASLASIGSGAGAQALVAPANARTGMLLGYSVSTLGGAGRDEIVAGAPGSADAMVIFCSGIEGDRASDLMDEPLVSRGCVVSVAGGPPPLCTGTDAGMSDAGTPDDAAMSDAGDPDAGDPIDAGMDAP